MKLLLATIKSENQNTELALRYLYGITVNSPVETVVRFYDSADLESTVYEEIISEQYDVIYFHCDEYNENKISVILEMVKRACPMAAIVVGGWHASINTRHFMSMNPSVDFVIRGEGETVLFDFLKTMLSKNYAFDRIKGLAYRYNNEIYVNKIDDVIPMENLPFPYEDLEIIDTECVYYETIRGTTDRTAYSILSSDAKIRALPVQRVFTELRYFFAKEVKKVVILDRFFNYNADRAYEIFDFIISNDNGITTFEININGDNIDDDVSRLLSTARTGLFIFNIDIVSTNAETLATVGRSENVYLTMYNISSFLKDKNILCNIIIKAGLPLETEGMFARTFNKLFGLSDAISMKVEMLDLPIGSALRYNAEKFGYYFSSKAPYEVLGNAYISAKEMVSIKHIAAVTNIYANKDFSSVISKLLIDMDYKPYEFFKQFSKYILERKFQSKIENEMDRYRVIYEFAEVIYFDDESSLEEVKKIIKESLKRNMLDEDVEEFIRKGWKVEF